MSPVEAGRVVAPIKAAATEAGRSIDEDHYGAGFAFHFGSRDAPVVDTAMDAYAKRNGRDATHAFAIGDADAILARVAEYVDAGVSKFILRSIGGDDDAILAQTRQLIEHVLPRAEARWPRRPKVTTADR
jgi:alkanesulfonate monooxygenase SsuD/methylene tetrahydromethanopterin reductase-like flavin-dependent oxidoreductase (luciferase family)